MTKILKDNVHFPTIIHTTIAGFQFLTWRGITERESRFRSRIGTNRPSVETEGGSFMSEEDGTKLFDHLRGSLPTRRIGKPKDLAEAALSMMTNPYITRTVLHADGGGRLA